MDRKQAVRKIREIQEVLFGVLEELDEISSVRDVETIKVEETKDKIGEAIDILNDILFDIEGWTRIRKVFGRS